MNKLIGGFLIIGVALIASGALVTKEKRRIKQLGGFTALIRFIFKQIEAFNMPIPEIISLADKELLSLCGFADGDSDILHVLTHKELYIDGKSKSLLINFASGLGKSYRDEQLKHCNYYISEIEKYCESEEKDYPRKRKLILTLTLCAAIGLIIIMI